MVSSSYVHITDVRSKYIFGLKGMQKSGSQTNVTFIVFRPVNDQRLSWSTSGRQLRSLVDLSSYFSDINLIIYFLLISYCFN